MKKGGKNINIYMFSQRLRIVRMNDKYMKKEIGKKS